MAMINGNALGRLGATGTYSFTIDGRTYEFPVELDENGEMIIPDDVKAERDRLMANSQQVIDEQKRADDSITADRIAEANRLTKEEADRIAAETADLKKKLAEADARATKSADDAKVATDKANETKLAADKVIADAATAKAAIDKAAADKAKIDLEKAKTDSAGGSKSLIDGMDNKTLLMIGAGLLAAMLLSKK